MFHRKTTPGVGLPIKIKRQQAIPEGTRTGVIWFITGMSMAAWAVALVITRPMETAISVPAFIMMMCVLPLVAVVATCQNTSREAL